LLTNAAGQHLGPSEEYTHGKHQVPAQADQDEREGAPAQQGRQVREAAEHGDKDKATELARAASRALDKAASKGVIHANQAANKKSAIAKRINAL
jgi:hypothetical protein